MVRADFRGEQDGTKTGGILGAESTQYSDGVRQGPREDSDGA